MFKQRYRSVGEIPAPIREDPSANHYWCDINCGHLHIGHTCMGEAEQFRMFRTPEDLADALIKLRGKATRRQVAEYAKIRPIRLKELEEPVAGQRVDLEALFAVLGAYRSRLGVSIRS